jgi:hypothetical protein
MGDAKNDRLKSILSLTPTINQIKLKKHSLFVTKRALIRINIKLNNNK